MNSNLPINMQQEIKRIDNRLEELRVEYVNASEGRKKFIESAAKLFKDKRERLIKLSEA